VAEEAAAALRMATMVLTTLLSGAVLLVVQALLAVAPVPRGWKAAAAGWLACGTFGHFVWLVEHLGNVTLRLHFEAGPAGEEMRSLFGAEPAVFLLNHSSGCDFAFGWAAAARGGCLSTVKALAKRELALLPVLGQQFGFSGACFLRRDWAVDEPAIARACAEWRGGMHSVCLFPEGTRFTPQKHEALWRRARESTPGCTPLRHLLPPREKGFSAVARGLPETPVYVVALCYAPREPTVRDLFTRRKLSVDVLVRRVPASQLPRDEEGAGRWLREAWQGQDALLDAYHAAGGAVPPGWAPQPHLVKAPWTLALVRACWLAIVSATLLWMRMHHQATGELPWAGLQRLGAVLSCVAVGGTVVGLRAADTKHSTDFAKPRK